jgi:hypothetical protein
MRTLIDGRSTPAPGNQPVAKFISEHLATSGVLNSVSVVSDASVATGMRNVSFGHEYAYNAYPAPKQTPSSSYQYPASSAAIGGL